ncbi:putative secreted protein [[Clostridium] cellulosi]|uniref:Putative secreted protein n=1 Tax=[Clostridium] cellulosi TaxID=29343 RepID=A0A078KHZ9_9FIRM|nr:putative secreted protein [[Clostridium] cellulosi]
MFGKGKKFLASVLTLTMLSLSTVALTVSAHSSSKTDKIPQLKGSITSNVWIQTISDLDGTGLFQVSAEYKSSSYPKPKWIKTAWDFNPIGIGVSVSYSRVSASASGSGYTKTSSGYWINSNGANTAWYRGRVGATGLCFYVGCENTASGFAAGVPFSTTAKV